MSLQLKKSVTLASVLLSLVAVDAFAYQTGDTIVRGGLAYVSPNDESSLAGVDVVSVDDGFSLGFGGTYMLSDRVGAELLLALPFKHDINGKGPLAGVAVGETQQLPPTVSIQYYPDMGGSKVQPYVGVGINYTTFFSEKLTSAAKTALDAHALALDDSLSFAAQAGVDFEVAPHCSVNVAYWYINIDTTATVKTNTAGNVNIDVGIDPHVLLVGAAYKF